MDPTKSDIHRLAVENIKAIFAKEPASLSVARLAELLGQGTEATYRMLEKGEIPATRLPNGRWLIYSASVCNWLTRYHDDRIREGEGNA